MRKYVIWSDIGLNYDDWKADLEEQYPEMTEEERLDVMFQNNADYLWDERANLNINLPCPILVIADLGLWNGHRDGYKEIRSGNIADCLSAEDSDDMAEWYVDGNGDLRGTGVHHDGTNRYLYRMWKEGTAEAQRETLKDKIYHGKATRADISRYTARIGDKVADVYGWRVRKTATPHKVVPKAA